ncbi:hypothetical protein [Amycolatopsis orientalis]|uniref:hypothetical protein n=1 Tax=Amycolatopsis orientalis TaxID=31958 RepID=UPI001F47E29F|nr:hypothetical protein [Amycolatopsis orientalis]
MVWVRRGLKDAFPASHERKAPFAACDERKGPFSHARLGRGFDTVLDCGLFHTFDADERVQYVKSLEAVTKGTLFILCFSDEGENAGPHPVKREALTAPFGRGWRVKTIERQRVRTRFHDENGAPAWFATIEREPSDE